MEKKRIKVHAAIIAITVVVVVGMLFTSGINIPKTINVLSGSESVINYSLPITVSLETNNNKTVSINGEIKDTYNVNLGKGVKIYSDGSGTVEFSAKLLGIVPLKSISVNVYPKTMLYPSGELIGLSMNTKGVIVVGFDDIKIGDKNYSPGKEGGLKKGDIITKVDSNTVTSVKEFKEILKNNKDKELSFTVDRQKDEINVKVTPKVDASSGEVRIGTWVRDNVSGIGTLTAYTVTGDKFCALGHAITDSNTDTIMPVNKGSVCYATFVSVVKGAAGDPGEIRGMFFENALKVGSIEKNNEYGIFGSLVPEIELKDIAPLEVAFQDEIKTGKAQILATVGDNGPKLYDVEIEKIAHQSTKNTKSMQIKVTDKELLDTTGGIVQGMSGSPIIQNGKIIGAVTHVFVNDPTRGYGIFIEWMLEELKTK